MGKNFTSVFVLCLAISAIPLACGGDDDDGGDDGNGGKGGSSGSSTGGKGGSAGSTSTGGKGGSAGSTSTGGKGGKGGTAGTAGIGGAEGGVGGAEGGIGGEGGGPPEPTLCERACAAHASLNCSNEANCPADNCLNFYEGATDRTTCDPLFDTIFECWADAPASEFTCNTKNGNADYTGSACVDEIDVAYTAGCFPGLMHRTSRMPAAFKSFIAAVTAAGIALGPITVCAQTKAGEASPKSEAAPAAGETAPSPAPAAPNEEAIAEAARRYDLGLRLYSEGEFRLAVIEFERTYQITKDYRVLYNIGQVRIQLGNYARAIGALNEYLKSGGDKVSEERRKAVEADLEMLAARTGHVRIVANIAGADILVDDLPVGMSPLPDLVLLDAGEHKITARKSGYDARAVQLTLAGRDSELLVNLELTKLPEGGSRVIVKEVEKKTSKGWIIGTWVATGALFVGAGVTWGLGSKEAKELEELREQSDPEPTRHDLDSAANRAQGLLLAGDLMAAAGLVTGGIALYLTLSNSGGSKETPPKSKAAAAPALTGFGLGPNSVSLQGEF